MDFQGRIAAIQAKAEKRKSKANKIANEEGRNLPENSVTKSNALARGYYRFGLNEKRIMESMVSRLDPRRSDNEFQDVELKAIDYAKVFGITEKSAYRELENAVDGLIHKVILIDMGNGDYEKYPLMAAAKYSSRNGKITATFNPKLTPHLQGLKKRFSSYPLKQTVDFKSSYTWRIYELLVSWAKNPTETGGVFAGWLTVEIEELRKMLGVPDSYKWDSFKKQVLNVAIKELDQKANIKVMVDYKKTSRKITHLKIEFIEDEQEKLPFGS